MKKNHQDIEKKDWLALERTRLANERTFLAYFRTSIVFMGGGLSILKMEIFSDVKYLGIILILLAPITFLVGIFRLFYVRRAIRKNFYKK